jgi:hypothetical protein
MGEPVLVRLDADLIAPLTELLAREARVRLVVTGARFPDIGAVVYIEAVAEEGATP